MSTEKYYLYIESYIFPFKEKNKILLYNTLNGDIFETEIDSFLSELTEKLMKAENNGVIEIGEQELKNQNLKDFITNLRQSYAGDLIKVKSEKKPIIMTPILNIQSDIERMKIDPSRSIGEKIMSYIKHITFYINGECEKKCNICKSAYKQFEFCRKTDTIEELKTDNIIKIISEAEGSSLMSINITGGNILFYSELSNLIKLLSETNYEKIYYLNYKHICSNPEKIKEFKGENLNIKVLTEPEIEKEELKTALKELDKSGIEYNILFVVTDEENYKKVENIIDELLLSKKSELRPFYTGENIVFFKENVYTEKDDIKNERLKFKDINGRKTININEFGRLTILNNGNIYANINNKKIGSIKYDSLYELIYKEIEEGESWFKRRDKVLPCKNCLYKYLCPPISNYEYVIGKYNLCKIWE